MTRFVILQESPFAPTIQFEFDGPRCHAALAGATLTAELDGGGAESANLSIVDEQGEVVADLTVRKVPTDHSIVETICFIGSALLWVHARYAKG